MGIDTIFEDIYEKLYQRSQPNFIPLSVQSILVKLRNYGKDKICNDFLARVRIVYYKTLEYFKVWTESFFEFKIFRWLDLKKGVDLQYKNVEKFMLHLLEKKLKSTMQNYMMKLSI